jgi:hypothetical protein
LHVSPRWSDEDARIVIDALNASGQSVASFAASWGFQAQRVFAWRRKLHENRAVAVRPVEFVEIDAHARPPSGRRYELILPGGGALRVEGGVDAGEVRTLVEILRESSSC